MKLKRELQILSDPGDAREHPEDGYAKNHPFYAVIDALSEPHSPQKPLRLVGGLTGGELVKNEIIKAVEEASPEMDLEEVILAANHHVRKKLSNLEYPIDDAGRLPGASCIFAKLNEGKDYIDLIWLGDCFSVCSLGGRRGFTKNKAYSHTSKCHLDIERLLKKRLSIGEMWNIYAPVLEKRRRRDINQNSRNGYPLLNGQPQVDYLWQFHRIFGEKLELLTLSSDGLVLPEDLSAKNMPETARAIINSLKSGMTLEGIMNAKRKIKKERKKSSHIRFDEATSLLLEFE